MPKKVPEKSAIEIKRLAKTPGMHSVGGVSGLYLAVGKGDSCSWILKTVVAGKRRELGLGPFPEVGVSDARKEAAALKSKFRQGKDPRAKQEKRKAKLKAKRSARSKALTFKQAAIQCHRAKSHEFTSDRHSASWIRQVEIHAFEKIGDINIALIETPHALSVLEPIWLTKTETANKVRQRMETIWSWAKVGGFCKGENPFAWRGHLDQVLPAPNKVRTRNHHPALPWTQIPEFMKALRRREGASARALEFAILTAARSGEVRLATWEEVDLKAGLWTISASRMKAGREHRVPLSEPAVRILERQSNNIPYLFPAPKLGPLSDVALLMVTRRMVVDAVPHGFRSTFKDWCRANTTYADEISELALAHVNSDATRAAYARDDLLEVRRQLMAEWGAFCG